MKNIHILPTEKSSKLSIEDGISILHRQQWRKGTKHIYITSDEEIKVGDWYYNPSSNKCEKCEYSYEAIACRVQPICKKIILTTDQDLINDGVQAIPDEFLKWFIKNPSCEEVGFSTYHVKGDISGKLHYQIIIPKEVDVLELGQIIPKEEPKKVLGVDYEFSIDDKGMSIEVPILKQETLEEVAERLYPTTIDSFTDTGIDLSETERIIFKEGVKWQQEQNKNKYSEEEVKSMLIKCFIWITSHTRTEHVINWFEQNKKK